MAIGIIILTTQFDKINFFFYHKSFTVFEYFLKYYTFFEKSTLQRLLYTPKRKMLYTIEIAIYLSYYIKKKTIHIFTLPFSISYLALEEYRKKIKS